MKRFIALCTVVLTLGGCAATFDPNERSILKGGPSITAEITNPARPVDIYRVKSVYNIALKAANQYRDYCWSQPYSALMAQPLSAAACKNRRAIVRQLDTADDRTYAAITKAEDFIAKNPRLSATSLVMAAWNEVTKFQDIATSVAIQ